MVGNSQPIGKTCNYAVPEAMNTCLYHRISNKSIKQQRKAICQCYGLFADEFPNNLPPRRYQRKQKHPRRSLSRERNPEYFK